LRYVLCVRESKVANDFPEPLFSAEHEDFPQGPSGAFVDEEIVPHHERWEEQQGVDRAIWKPAPVKPPAFLLR